MQRVTFDLSKYKQPIQATAYEFQNRALEIIEFLNPPPNKKSEIFRLVKQKRDKAESVFRYMQERKIHNVFYFFKVMGQ